MTVLEARAMGWGIRAQEFSRWWNQINDLCVNDIGVGIRDLMDWDFAEAFDQGRTPSEAYQDMIQELGLCDGVLVDCCD